MSAVLIFLLTVIRDVVLLALCAGWVGGCALMLNQNVDELFKTKKKEEDA